MADSASFSTRVARTVTALVSSVLLVGAASAQTVALRGADLHTVSDGVIEDGIMVIEDGEIVALGDSTTAVPAGAELIDLTGKRVYPGFVQAYSNLGLTEIDSVRGSVDVGEMGDNNADVRSEVAVSADNIRLLPAIGGGSTHAHVVAEGGRFSGTTAVLRLDGWNWEDMTLDTPTGLHFTFPEVAADQEVSEAKDVKEVNAMFEDARRYGRAREAGLRIDRDRKLENLLAVLEGELRLFVHADRTKQIESALTWTEEMGIEDWVLISTPDVLYHAEALAERNVPVILESVLSIPGRDVEAYDHNFSAPARLAEAGVTFVIAAQGDSAFARNLPFIAGMATAYGFDRQAALRSVTLGVAEVLQVDDRIGSLAVGKEASFFVANGDPLEITTDVERVWIAGQEIDLGRDPQRQLWTRYRDRPTP